MAAPMPQPRAWRSFAIAAVLIAGCASTGLSPAPIATSTAGPTTPTASPTAGASSGAPSSAPLPTGSSGSWSVVGEIPAVTNEMGRLQPHVSILGATDVLVVGSDNVCTPGAAWPESATSIVGTPATSTWTLGPSLPKARDRFAIAHLTDGSVLVAGGTTGASLGDAASLRSTYRLKPGGSAWVRSGDLDVARSAPSVAVLTDGRVLVAGGYYADLPANPPMHMIRSAELYDAATEAWSPTGSLVTARYGAGMTTLADGRVLIAGGWPDVDNSWPAPNYGDHQPLASTELYDPKTGQWSAAGGLPVAMGEPTVVPLPGGGALAFGGTNVARFEPASGTWTATSPMLSAAAHRRAVALEDGRVLVAGGDVGGAFTAEAETFDPATGSWTATARMPAPRSGGAAIRLGDGSVLLVGGEAEPGQGDPSCAVTATQVVRFAP